MARRLLGIPLLVLSLTAAADVADGKCPCRSQDGQLRPQGTVSCLTIAGTPRMVQCSMSENTPYWRRLTDADGCPTA